MRTNANSIVAPILAAVIGATMVGMLVTLPQPMPNGQQQWLAFRASAPLPRTEEADERTSPRANERTQVNTVSVGAIIVAQRAEGASEGTAQQPQRTDEGADRGARQTGAQTAKDAAEEALRKLRAAQRAAGEAFKQLHAAQQKQVAKASPDAAEQQLAREQAAKEAAAKEAAAKAAAAKEAAAKQAAERAPETRKAAAEAELVKMSAANDQQRWDCRPSSPSGQIVCRPTGKKLPRKGSQSWDCRPSPPAGKVVCRPIPHAPFAR